MVGDSVGRAELAGLAGPVMVVPLTLMLMRGMSLPPCAAKLSSPWLLTQGMTSPSAQAALLSLPVLTLPT